MVDLASLSPLAGAVLPVQVGGFTIDEVPVGSAVSLMPFEGQEDVVSTKLKRAVGIALPPVGRVASGETAELIWIGQNQWFLRGQSALPTIPEAAVTDQSDGWAVLSLRGESCGEVMARLCPLDLRHFKPGQVARTEFAHMMSTILPREGGYDIWVMRSFAKTALHHLKDAAQNLTAIRALRS